MVPSVLTGTQPPLHPLNVYLVSLYSGSTRFIESVKGIPSFLFPDAVLHDPQQVACKRKSGVML
jgi:hypothetical protein